MAGWTASQAARRSTIPAWWPSWKIVLDGQGNVDRVAMVKSSGMTVYDSAAIDVVYSAAPYPPRPRPSFPAMARSTSTGPSIATKRPAATAGVDTFILNNGPHSREKKNSG